MRKWLIILVLLLVVVGGVLALALANLSSYLNRNREWIGDRAEAALGRTVTFGEVGVSVIGGIGARVSGLRVADDPAYSKDDFVGAREAQVNVRILPALFGRFEVARVVLREPSVAIIRDRAGFNFESIGGVKGPGEPPTVAERAAAPEGAPPAFLVALMDIKNATVRYVDRTSSPPTDVVVKDLDVTASNVGTTEPVEVHVAAALFGSEKRNVDLRGEVGPVGAVPNLQTIPFDLSVDLGPVVLDELQKIPALAAALPKEIVVSDPLRLSAQASGSPESFRLEGRLDGKASSLGYGSVFRKPAGIPLWLDVTATRAGSSLGVEKLGLGLADLELSGQGKMGLGPPVTYDFAIESNRASLQRWDRLLPQLSGHEVSGTAEIDLQAQGKVTPGALPVLKGTVALENVNARAAGSPYEIEGLSTKIVFEKDSAVLPPTSFRLGGSPLEVQANVSDLRTPTVDFSLSSPALRLAPLGAGGEGLKSEEVVRELQVRGRLRTGGPRPEFQGSVTSPAGTLRDVDYVDLAADLALREGILTLDKTSLKAFGGTCSADGRYDMRAAESPKFDFRSSVREVGLEELLASQAPAAAGRITGRLVADLEIGGAGKEWGTIQKALTGRGRIEVKDGILKDVNIAEGVLSGMTGIGGLSNLVSSKVREKYPEVFGTGDTRFEQMSGSVRIADGQATTDDLLIAARDYAVRGKGALSFENRIDFTATFVASRDLTADITGGVSEVKYITNTDGRLEVPFRLAGTPPKLRPAVDNEFIVKALARATVRRGLEALVGEKKEGPAEEGKEAKEKPSGADALRKGLEGLFGR